VWCKQAVETASYVLCDCKALSVLRFLEIRWLCWHLHQQDTIQCCWMLQQRVVNKMRKCRGTRVVEVPAIMRYTVLLRGGASCLVWNFCFNLLEHFITIISNCHYFPVIIYWHLSVNKEGTLCNEFPTFPQAIVGHCLSTVSMLTSRWQCVLYTRGLGVHYAVTSGHL
jgi:hypothetical protein